jgi:predicted  nucleic acid-binding Zn-ribbon protein
LLVGLCNAAHHLGATLNWRHDPVYEQRVMQHKQRMEQLESNILRVRSDRERIESEILQIKKEAEQLRRETVRLRQLNARESLERLDQAALLSARVQLDPCASNRERLRIFLELMGQRALDTL